MRAGLREEISLGWKKLKFFCVFFTNNLQNNSYVPFYDIQSKELKIIFREKIETKRGREKVKMKNKSFSRWTFTFSSWFCYPLI